MYDHGTTIVRGLRLVEALDTRRNEVWRAVADTQGGAAVIDGQTAPMAVKLLHPAYEPVLPKRIGRRARSLTRIVRYGTQWLPLLDHGHTTDGRRYVVSPLLGGSLADQLEHGPMPWYPATRLMADAAAAVAEAHAAGLTLGYLRPSGILIDGPADVRVAVYGMSTRRFDDGTAQFMAPEVTGEGSPIPPSDVFSLALILTSLIAGRPVDRSESSRELISELSASAPERILEIIEYGLSTGVRNRYADAGKMAGALETALREQGASVRRGRSTPPEDAIDPLSALLAEPLVTVPTDRSAGDSARHRVANHVPDLRDPRNPDETPTAVPFDLPIVELDDPTDPGIAARRALDTETDHFGALAHLDIALLPRGRAESGPLADLLTVAEPGSARHRPSTDTNPGLIQRGDPGPVDRSGDDYGDDNGDDIGVDTGNDAGNDTGNDTGSDKADTDTDLATHRHGATEQRPASAARSVQPGPGSIIDIADRTNGSTSAHPKQVSGSTEHAAPFSEPSRMFVLADDIGHFLAMHRRRLASSVAIIGITGAIGVALLVGIGDLLRSDTITTGGTPVSSSIVEQQTTLERSSPLNDQAPLENARSLSYEDIPTTLPVRRTTEAVATSTTADEATTTVDESTPTTVDTVTSTTEEIQSTTETTARKNRRATTTAPTAPPTTEATTTTERPTTTTAEGTTSTTKRKGPKQP